MNKALLEYKHFCLSLISSVNSNTKALVNDVSISVFPNKITALIGLSGSGKTLCANAPLKLWPSDFNAKADGEILFLSRNNEPINLIKASEQDLQRIRGGEIGFVFQEAAANLNPTKTVGSHLIDTLLFA
jgi:ABC-type dipeptide/oligopeptide/nickel transport system ATPase component